MKGSEIENLVFSMNFLGYKKSDVKDCLKEISQYVMRLEEKVRELQMERDKLKSEIHRNEANNENFKVIIKSAQEFKNRIESEATEKAKSIVEKAKKEYEFILKSIKIESSKLSFLKREFENFKNSLFDKLSNIVKTIEIKEKNLKINDSNNKMEFDDFDGINEIKKIIDSPNIKNSDDKENETIEFSTNSKISNDDSESIDDEYIKSKFNEIELR